MLVMNYLLNRMNNCCFIKIQGSAMQLLVKKVEYKKNRFRYYIKCNLLSFHKENFEFWLFKNSLINTSKIASDLNCALSESFNSSKNLNKKLNKLQISLEPLEINIKQYPKNFLIFDDGFGRDKKSVLPFFKLISQPVPFKKSHKYGKNNHQIPPNCLIFFDVKHLKIITKKIGSESLILFNVDFKTNRIFFFESLSNKACSFTFLNLNGTFTKHSSTSGVYTQFKKNLLSKPLWLNFKLYLIENKIKKKIDEKKNFRLIQKNTDIFLFSSIKFIQKKDYLNLFEKLSSRWNYPLCMLHFSICQEQKIDMIIFIPRYFSTRFLINGFSLFKNRTSCRYRKSNLNFSIKKFTPEWLSFGEGILKIKNGSCESNFDSENGSYLENEIKKEISKKFTELLSNFSLKNPCSYNFFWTTYNQELRSNLIKNKYFLENFFHLLRFYSSCSGNSVISLNDYILNMKRGQHEIYYYSVKNNFLSKHQPDLEILSNRRIEVLLIFDTIDEVIIELLKKKQNDWNGKAIFFKRVGSIEYYDYFQKHITNKFKSVWEPSLCLKWFSFEFSKKFLRMENSNFLWSSSSNFVFSEDLLVSGASSSSDIKRKNKKTLRLLSTEQNIVFDINGSNSLIRILNKYLKTKKTKKTSKEIGLLLWELTHTKCGMLMNDKKNFIKRIENFLIIFLLILYSKDTMESDI